MARQSSVTHGTNVRRKLYSTQNTPKELPRESRLFSASKAQQTKATDINRNQTARKSLLLPPNSIKEYYVRKRLSKGTILEVSHEDASVQTSNETLASASLENPFKPVEVTSNAKADSATNPRQSIVNGVEKISSQLSTENECNNKVERNIERKSVNTDSTVPLLHVADTTEKGMEAESANVQSQFLRPSVIIEPRILHPLQGYSESGYSFYPQHLFTNPILLQVPHDAEIPRISQNVPTINSTYNLGSEHLIVERNKLLSIEAYLKEGIVNMTQALNLVQTTLYSNPLSAQVCS